MKAEPMQATIVAATARRGPHRKPMTTTRATGAMLATDETPSPSQMEMPTVNR